MDYFKGITDQMDCLHCVSVLLRLTRKSGNILSANLISSSCWQKWVLKLSKLTMSMFQGAMNVWSVLHKTLVGLLTLYPEDHEGKVLELRVERCLPSLHSVLEQDAPRSTQEATTVKT